jgi:uncharacterized membrane protein YesL
MNFDKYANGRLFSFFNFFYKMVILSMLLFLTATLGLGVFGLTSGLITAFVIIRSSGDDKELPLFLTFWLVFWRVFKKSLVLSIIYLVLSLLFAFNTYYFYMLTKQTSSMYSFIALYFTIGLDILTVISYLKMILTCVYFPYLKIKNTIKYSLILLFAFPGNFFIYLGMVLGLLACFYLVPYLVPVLLPGLFLYFTYRLYDTKLMLLVSPDGILPLDASALVDSYRATKKRKK